MKTVKIKFVDQFKTMETVILDILKRRYNVVISDSPDYIICSCFGQQFLDYDCVKILVLAENIRPDFNLYDYAIAFDYMTYGDRYIRYPYYAWHKGGEMLRLALTKHCLEKAVMDEKELFCNFIVSNQNAASPFREQFFHSLNCKRRVESGGKLFNNIGGPVKDKFQLQKKCRFSITFENSSMLGYTTEKIIEAWAAGTIPIYWGNPQIGEEFNEKAFINCHNYKNIEDIVNKVMEIDNNKELYDNMMREPIYYPESDVLQYVKTSYLEHFFWNIFDQDYDQAYRRTNRKVGWGAKYEREVREYREMKSSVLVHTTYKAYKKIKSSITNENIGGDK